MDVGGLQLSSDNLLMEEGENEDALPSSARQRVISSMTEDTLAMLKDVFAALYADYPLQVAKEASRRERKENQYISMSLVYGEIVFDSFKTVIDILKRWHHVLVRPGGVFLDIGSGSGKAVFAATLAHDFDACYGIEILQNLHTISMEVLQVWDKKIKKQFPLSMQKKRTRILFTHGDALDVEWPSGSNGADLIFLNSTCFTALLLRNITRKLSISCKPGAVVITATHELPDTQAFECVRTLSVLQEAWGEATWFIYRKK